MVERINLVAGTSRDGRTAFEEVLVDPQGPGRFILIRSPGLVLGVAAGDLIEVSSNGEFTVLARGGNVCIQIFRTGDIEPMTPYVESATTSLNGRLDGKSTRLLVATVPIQAGLPTIEKVFAKLVAQFPGAEWYYGNVYDPKDGTTPLNWWPESGV